MVRKYYEADGLGEGGGSTKLPVMRRLAEVGMKVICRQSGLTATIQTIFPNRFIYSSYDEPTQNSGDGVATTARGLRCVDGAEVMHPNGA